MHVFVSYPSTRRAQAEPVAMALRSRGHTVFFDRDDLRAGTSYHDRIAASIRESHVAVFLLAEESLAKGRYTLTEIELAQKRWTNPSHHVLPVLLDPMPLERLPAYLREVTVLCPSGNLAAEVAAGVDGLGWNGLPKSAPRIFSGIFGSLLLLSAMWTCVAKQEWYDCWSWMGFFTDSQPAVLILAICLLPSLFAFGLARLRTRSDPLTHGFAMLAEGRTASTALALCGFAILGTGYILSFRDAGPCSSNLERIVSDENWDLANEELERLAAQPLKPEIFEALRMHVRNAATAARYEFPPVNLLRQHRASLLRLLDEGQDYRSLATFAFANNSRSIFFQEDDTSLLDEAIHQLEQRLLDHRDPETAGILWQKIGELQLARKNFSACRKACDEAISLLPEGPPRSVAYANRASTFAVEGNTNKAIHDYQAAEKHYPQGRRFLFYSNLGYIYMLSGRLIEAEDAIQRALRIKSDDWVSRLNLGLVYEKLMRPEDALLAFRSVVKQAPADIDAAREARLLLTRAAEVSGADEREVLSLALTALDRSSESTAIDRLRTDPAERAQLYRDLAGAMRRVDTHGIDEYISWFDRRAAQIESANAASSASYP